MNIQNLLFFVCILTTLFVDGQKQSDTIQLRPVEISAETMGIQSMVFEDSLNNLKVSLTSLSEQLKTYTPVFIKEYSPGGISTLAFRGTSASHTVVLFDGFPVNPAMSGQADFSTMPPFLYDKVQIIGSPASIILSPEAPGGVVSMFTNPVEKNKNGLKLRLESGSFGNVGGGIQFHKKIGKFLFRTRAYYHKADNDFIFVNNTLPDRSTEKRINAGFEKKGMMQEVFYIGNKQIAFAKFTATENHNQLPAMLFQPQIHDNEWFDNKVIRLITGYTRSHKQHFFSIKTHYSSEDWEYWNKSNSIQGMNTIKTYSILGDWQYRFQNKNDIKFQWFSQQQEVISNNYLLLPNMHTHRASVSGNFFHKHYRFRPVVHFMKKDNKKPQLAGAIILDRTFLKKKATASASVGRSIRYPGFNDLYWYPGGNPLLEPETSISANAETEFHLHKNWSFATGITRHDVNNWVVWQPTNNSSVWSPINVKRVVSTSVDFLNVIQLKLFKTDLQSVLSYSYCMTHDVSDESSPLYKTTLMYVPMHTASHTGKASYKKLSLTIKSTYTGKRYTRADNLSYMPGHFHHDLLLSQTHQMKTCTIEIFAGVYNFTGENYQIIAWQPMPRRYLKIAILIEI
jgi:vitamin B12 transporter